MEKYLKNIIIGAFKRCYGLQGTIQKGLKGSIEELSKQTSISVKYIEKNLEEIKSL